MTHREKQGLTALTILLFIILLVLFFGKWSNRNATDNPNAPESTIAAQLSATDTLPAADSVPSGSDTTGLQRNTDRLRRGKHPVMRTPKIERTDRLSPHDRPMR